MKAVVKKIIFYIFVYFLCSPGWLQASQVYVRGEKGNWFLEVDGRPFYIKGAGCGLAAGRKGEDYLKLANELGANSVRTWGTDQGNQHYLDTAARYGLKVAAGIWLNYVADDGSFSYRYDKEYLETKRREVFDYIKKYKDHPAILIWGLGNEALFFTKEEEEKIAFCNFLEELIREIHRLDPAHPVCYAGAGTTALPYLLKYVPSLDIIGMNVYGSIRTAQGAWEYQGFDKPYLLTEYGSHLSADRPKDGNNKPIELSDENKAKIYKDLAGQIYSFKGNNVGGFVFHLGETTQESMTWWNINEGGLKRESFWKIYEVYTGRKPPHKPIRIAKFLVSKINNISPSELIEVKAGAREQAGNDLSITYAISSAKENIMMYYVNEYIPTEVFYSEDGARIRVPSKGGIYRIYCFVRDKFGNAASQSKTIRVE